MQNVWLIIIKKVYDSYTNIDYIIIIMVIYIGNESEKY